ncbi:MAG TPA: hypothetical protein VN841_06145 [Bryobacteraceae bacterium]|nr:hypothetical protein [Bryobacteraceae bacterium]
MRLSSCSKALSLCKSQVNGPVTGKRAPGKRGRPIHVQESGYVLTALVVVDQLPGVVDLPPGEFQMRPNFTARLMNAFGREEKELH